MTYNTTASAAQATAPDIMMPRVAAEILIAIVIYTTYSQNAFPKHLEPVQGIYTVLFTRQKNG